MLSQTSQSVTPNYASCAQYVVDTPGDTRMDLIRVPIARINPAPYNPRKNLKPGDPEYERLKRSIDDFGLVEPLVWNTRTGHLVGGHQRFKVIKARGDQKVIVSRVDLPLEREKALNIALNKVQGEWDRDALAELLDELCKLPEFDIESTGFDADESAALIADMLHRACGDDAESFDVEAAMRWAGTATDTVTKPGDLITLGRDPRFQHRLLCGDCTDPEHVRRLMNGQRAVLFSTDPPYLVGYDGMNHPASKKRGRAGAKAHLPSGNGVKAGSSGGVPGVRSKQRPPKDANKDWSASYGVTWDDKDADPALYRKFIKVAIDVAITDDAAWYCWHASRRQAMVEAVWTEMGAFVHQQIIWVKDRPILTRSWYTWQHEPCLFGWRRPNKPPRRATNVLPGVWNVPTVPVGQPTEHPTSKPTQLFEVPILQHTRKGEVCYEPFAGSGSQFIAAHKLGRRCYGLEISPAYCDVIVRRFIALSGEAAVSPEIARKYRRAESAGKKGAAA